MISCFWIFDWHFAFRLILLINLNISWYKLKQGKHYQVIFFSGIFWIYCRWLRTLLLDLCYVFWALINSLVCWFYMSGSRPRSVSDFLIFHWNCAFDSVLKFIIFVTAVGIRGSFSRDAVDVGQSVAQQPLVWVSHGHRWAFVSHWFEMNTIPYEGEHAGQRVRCSQTQDSHYFTLNKAIKTNKLLDPST